MGAVLGRVWCLGETNGGWLGGDVGAVGRLPSPYGEVVCGGCVGACVVFGRDKRRLAWWRCVGGWPFA